MTLSIQRSMREKRAFLTAHARQGQLVNTEWQCCSYTFSIARRISVITIYKLKT